MTDADKPQPTESRHSILARYIAGKITPEEWKRLCSADPELEKLWEKSPEAAMRRLRRPMAPQN